MKMRLSLFGKNVAQKELKKIFPKTSPMASGTENISNSAKNGHFTSFLPTRF